MIRPCNPPSSLFLSVCLLTVIGNLLIILAVSSDSHLHTPMYFFLSNLSFVDICLTSTIIPKMLLNIQAQNKGISYTECLTQVYFFMIFDGMDNFLLTVMAYDRFVAICHPLKYIIIMNSQLCVLLILVSWFIIFWVALMHLLLILHLTFTRGTEILHFFCDLPALLQVASSDTHINDAVLYVATVLLGVFPATGILFSYSRIVSSLMRMSSSESSLRHFPLRSHLCMVSLYYGQALQITLASHHSSPGKHDCSVMYTVVTPMLNPFIYSLRNKDVKRALGRLLSRTICFPGWTTDLKT
nr:LOW QUALITY PROTEIN: olfactory receptor 7D4-like [Cavia porcellus]